MAVFTVASMFLKLFGHGNQGLVCYGCADVAAGYFVPFLVAAGFFQLHHKWKYAKDNFQKYTSLYNIAVMVAFLLQTGWYIISGLIEQPELFTLSISNVFYIPFIPILVAGDIVIWMTKQVRETLATRSIDKP